MPTSRIRQHPNLTLQYIGGLFQGTLSIIPRPAAKQITRLAILGSSLRSAAQLLCCAVTRLPIGRTVARKRILRSIVQAWRPVADPLRRLHRQGEPHSTTRFSAICAEGNGEPQPVPSRRRSRPIITPS